MSPEAVAALSNTQALQEFFTRGGGKKITMDEFRSCPKEEREELATLAREQLLKEG